MSRVKLSCYFCSVFFDISLWKDLWLHNVYKSFNFITKIMFCKECVSRGSLYLWWGPFLAHFWLIWDEEQPEEIQKLPFHPEKTTVWWGMGRWNHQSIFLQKWCRWERNRQWRSLSCHDNRLFDTWNWNSWTRRHLISTRRRHFPHMQSMDILRENFGEQIISLLASRLATKIVGYYKVRLFAVRICKV